MGIVSLTGALVGGLNSPEGYPGSVFNVPVALSEARKLWTNATGVLTRTIESPDAFVVMSAIGPEADVPAANTIYGRSNAPLDLRITQDDGDGGSTVIILAVSGTFLFETPPTKQITLLEARGTALLEYFASGP